MLQELGAGNIIASGLADIQLQSLRDRGLLKGCEVRAINAECIDVADESVDFVFCRQAFHHFPRPFVGFYEMLRVCRVGVILIEPADVDSLRPLEHVRALAKMLLRRPGQENRLFEPAGNFIYRVSRRELWKACVALQLDSLYTRPFNHFFLRDVCAAPTTDRTRLVAYHTAVGLQDLLAKAGLLSWGLLAAVVAKQSLGSAADTALRSSGFRRERLPRNPYL